MSKEPVWKRSLLDLAAVFFLIAGVLGLVGCIIMIPITTIYPFRLAGAMTFVTLVVLIVGIICSVESFECYSFVSKRMLHKAGIRGVIVGAILLCLSLGLLTSRGQLVTASAILMIIAGAICYVYRE